MKKSVSIYVRLGVMMFLQYMLMASFFEPLALFLKNMKMGDFMIATITATLGWGSLISPMVGMVADRYINGERVLSILNMFVAIFLCMAAYFSSCEHLGESRNILIFVSIFLAMCAYMPTWGMTSSIAMTHSDPNYFPWIRLCGTAGWVSAAIFSIIALKVFDKHIDGTNITLYCGSGVALVASLFAFTLPSTPPPAKGTPMSLIDTFGLRSLEMLKDGNLRVFMMSTFCRTFVYSMYFLYMSEFLNHVGVKMIVATANVGQIIEVCCLFALPFVIRVIGLKYTMALGLLALAIRYICFRFTTPEHPDLLWGAIVMQGPIFGCFLVSAQIYMDRKSPKELRSQAQGLFFCITEGFGLLLGAYLMRALIYVCTDNNVVDWEQVYTIVSIMAVALLVFFLTCFRDKIAMKSYKADKI